MIGIDTNVLVRYLVRDDPAQTERATAVIEGRCSADVPDFVCHVVLAELVWEQKNWIGSAPGRSRRPIRGDSPPHGNRGLDTRLAAL